MATTVHHRNLNAILPFPLFDSLAAGQNYFEQLFRSVITNAVVISSCDLLRYDDESTLGFLKYTDEETGRCTSFEILEDETLKFARTAAIAALCLGCTFLSLIAVNSVDVKVPGTYMFHTLVGTCLQFSLLMVYAAKNNGICEVEGCTWGSAATWLAISQLLYLFAIIGAIYTGVSLWSKQKTFSHRMSMGQRLEQELAFGYC